MPTVSTVCRRRDTKERVKMDRLGVSLFHVLPDPSSDDLLRLLADFMGRERMLDEQNRIVWHHELANFEMLTRNHIQQLQKETQNETR